MLLLKPVCRISPVFWLLLAFVLAGGNLLAQSADHPLRQQRLDSILHAHITHEGKQPVHNFMLYLEDDRRGNAFHLAAGYRGRDTTPTRPNDQYRIASITKTFLATVILQMWEEGKIDLQDRAADYLSGIDYLRFDEFLLLNKTSYADRITIEQLLQHGSGLADIFTDAEFKFNLSVLTHKRRHYDVPRIVKRYFKYNLHKKPSSKPGEGYHYSDMNYLLLGLIIEQVSGESLPQQIRTRILEPLAMDNTWYEYYEAPAGHGRTADAYFNRIKVTEKINTSYEWGGGGMISTTRELGIFFKALLAGELFERESTAEMMMDTAPSENYGGSYGMGLIKYELGEYSFYGHGGFYGSLTMRDPVKGITFSANIGQANAPFDAQGLVESILQAGLE